MYEVQLSRRARKQLDRLRTRVAQRIIDALATLEKDPRHDGVKPIQDHGNLYRVRVGAYRVVYSIEDNILVVHVLRIGHRSEIYQQLKRR